MGVTLSSCTAGTDEDCVKHYGVGACCMRVEMTAVPAKPNDLETDLLNLLESGGYPILKDTEKHLCHSKENWEALRDEANELNVISVVTTNKNRVTYRAYCDSASS